MCCLAHGNDVASPTYVTHLFVTGTRGSCPTRIEILRNPLNVILLSDLCADHLCISLPR